MISGYVRPHQAGKLPPLRATIDPNYQKLFSQSLIVEISRKRAPLESDREHFWGIHFYNFPLFSSLLQVDLLASGAREPCLAATP